MKKSAALLAGLVMLVAACGSSFSREDAIADLVQSGLEQPVAECVVDNLDGTLTVEKLGSPGELSSTEETVLIQITTECILG